MKANVGGAVIVSRSGKERKKTSVHGVVVHAASLSNNREKSFLVQARLFSVDKCTVHIYSYGQTMHGASELKTS